VKSSWIRTKTTRIETKRLELQPISVVQTKNQTEPRNAK